MRATCSIRRSQCGTRGRSTTPSRPATWSRRSTPPPTQRRPADEAISYAAYRVLTARFIKSVGADVSLSEFDDLMDALGYPLTVTTIDGDSPAAVGNRIAKAVLADALDDGSNQTGSYKDTSYKPVNGPLVVNQPGTTMVDPNRWQPLQIENMISQNGIPVDQRRTGERGASLGRRGLVRPGTGRRQAPAHRPGAPAATRRSRYGPGVQGPGGSGDPAQQPAGSCRRRHRGHLARDNRQQHAGHQRWPRAHGQPRDGQAVRAGRRQSGRLRSGPRRVLGRRPPLRDSAGPLERARQ